MPMQAKAEELNCSMQKHSYGLCWGLFWCCCGLPTVGPCILWWRVIF